LKSISISSHDPKNIFLTAGYDGSVKIVDLNPKTETKILAGYFGHKSIVTMARFFGSKDNKILSCSFDRMIKVWSSHDAICEKTLQGHSEAVTSCDITRDGRFVVSGSTDCTIRLWDVEKQSCLCLLKKSSKWIKVVKFSVDDKYILATGLDKKLVSMDLSQIFSSLSLANDTKVLNENENVLFQSVNKDILYKKGRRNAIVFDVRIW
jgi:WD40 repeat protein